MKTNIFWFRKDLRLEDNTALNVALNAGLPVLPIYIFDKHVVADLPKNDSGIAFVHQKLKQINIELQKYEASINVMLDDTLLALEKIITENNIDTVYANRDYEPQAIIQDEKVKKLLTKHAVKFKTYKDRVILEPGEVLKDDGKPYIVFTPYKNKCLKIIQNDGKEIFNSEMPDMRAFVKVRNEFPELKKFGFSDPEFNVRDYDLSNIKNYHNTRDFPYLDSGSYLGPHLRFGTVSIRKIAKIAMEQNEVFLSELLWREFFIQILYYFPHVESGAFRKKYDYINWRNNEEEFHKWSRGETGYPLVDAGMKELNTTGYMHNRVRMITASFLVKHLLIDWKLGESYFAGKLLDYEPASNNGNWQWVAGTGCDAAPYFRVFNPIQQQKKYDKDFKYIKKFIPEELSYKNKQIVDHDMARKRAIKVYNNINHNNI